MQNEIRQIIAEEFERMMIEQHKPSPVIRFNDLIEEAASVGGEISTPFMSEEEFESINKPDDDLIPEDPVMDSGLWPTTADLMEKVPKS